MGAKRKERDKVRKAIEPDKKWWKFLRKTKVKPVRQLDIQHNVNLTRGYDGESECYEMGKYMDRDNNHYRWVGAPSSLVFVSFLIRAIFVDHRV